MQGSFRNSHEGLLTSAEPAKEALVLDLTGPPHLAWAAGLLNHPLPERSLLSERMSAGMPVCLAADGFRPPIPAREKPSELFGTLQSACLFGDSEIFA
mmetsp:Transcript_13888/g.33132  ORF Transcript_13888/g.33132 Transcript_13888/m.33132 type:complete len:98 (-) Transcript_13888:142-435(-)